MELFVILLSGLFSVVSSGGLIVDILAGNLLDSKVKEIEQLVTRIDNTPNYQLIQGKVDRVRIASRGLKINPYWQMDTLEIETEPIDINLNNLETNNLEAIRKSLRKPLQGAVRLVITEENLNQTLQSPELQTQLQQELNRLVSQRIGSSAFSYQLFKPRLEFIEDNKIGLQFQLSRLSSRKSRFQELAIELESQIRVLEGTKIELVNPKGTVNNRPVSNRLLTNFAKRISNRLNFTNLEQNGIFVRLLQLEINNNQIELAAFMRMQTEKATIPIQKQ